MLFKRGKIASFWDHAAIFHREKKHIADDTYWHTAVFGDVSYARQKSHQIRWPVLSDV